MNFYRDPQRSLEVELEDLNYQYLNNPGIMRVGESEFLAGRFAVFATRIDCHYTGSSFDTAEYTISYMEAYTAIENYGRVVYPKLVIDSLDFETMMKYYGILIQQNVALSDFTDKFNRQGATDWHVSGFVEIPIFYRELDDYFFDLSDMRESRYRSSDYYDSLRAAGQLNVKRDTEYYYELKYRASSTTNEYRRAYRKKMLAEFKALEESDYVLYLDIQTRLDVEVNLVEAQLATSDYTSYNERASQYKIDVLTYMQEYRANYYRYRDVLSMTPFDMNSYALAFDVEMTFWFDENHFFQVELVPRIASFQLLLAPVVFGLKQPHKEYASGYNGMLTVARLLGGKGSDADVTDDLISFMEFNQLSKYTCRTAVNAVWSLNSTSLQTQFTYLDSFDFVEEDALKQLSVEYNLNRHLN